MIQLTKLLTKPKFVALAASALVIALICLFTPLKLFLISGSFAYTWIGKSGEMAMKGKDRISLFLALSFLALLSVLPILYKRNKI